MLLSSLHDLEADALYVTLNQGTVVRSVELDDGTLVDVDGDGRPLGLEVIHPQRQWPIEELIRNFPLLPAGVAAALRVYADGFRTSPPSFKGRRKASTGSGKLAKLRPVAV